MKRARVKLTLQQADAVQWALDVMPDFWCTDAGCHERGDDRKYWPNELPAIISDGTRKTSRILELSQHDDINSDLLYRLEVQLSDMVSDNTPAEHASAKAGRNAALRIRHRKPDLAKLPRGGGWI